MNFFTRMFSGRQPPGPESQDEINEELRNWKVVTVELEGQLKLTIRLRMQKPPLPPGRAFNHAIEIVWPYEGGFPDKALNEKQLNFDRALDDLTGMNGFSELMSVVTGDGTREWLFYSSDQQRFMREFNRTLESHEKYPIEISFYDDPEWKLWKEIVDGVNEKAPALETK